MMTKTKFLERWERDRRRKEARQRAETIKRNKAADKEFTAFKISKYKNPHIEDWETAEHRLRMRFIK